MSLTVAVINCGAEKCSSSKKAKDLYTGSLFVASRQYVESNYDSYIILSAKYHMCLPNDILQPYELYLGHLSKADKKVWNEITAQEMAQTFPVGTVFDFYTSKMYQEGLIPILRSLGYTCNTNLNNLGMGYKIQWFQQHTKRNTKKLF